MQLKSSKGFVNPINLDNMLRLNTKLKLRREREAVRIREELKIVEETKKIDIQEEPKEISLTEEQLQKISFENKKRMMSLKRLDFEEVSLNESAQLDNEFLLKRFFIHGQQTRVFILLLMGDICLGLGVK